MVFAPPLPLSTFPLTLCYSSRDVGAGGVICNRVWVVAPLAGGFGSTVGIVTKKFLKDPDGDGHIAIGPTRPSAPFPPPSPLSPHLSLASAPSLSFPPVRLSLGLSLVSSLLHAFPLPFPRMACPYGLSGPCPNTTVYHPRVWPAHCSLPLVGALTLAKTSSKRRHGPFSGDCDEVHRTHGTTELPQVAVDRYAHTVVSQSSFSSACHLDWISSPVLSFLQPLPSPSAMDFRVHALWAHHHVVCGLRLPSTGPVRSRGNATPLYDNRLTPTISVVGTGWRVPTTRRLLLVVSWGCWGRDYIQQAWSNSTVLSGTRSKHFMSMPTRGTRSRSLSILSEEGGSDSGPRVTFALHRVARRCNAVCKAKRISASV